MFVDRLSISTSNEEGARIGNLVVSVGFGSFVGDAEDSSITGWVPPGVFSRVVVVLSVPCACRSRTKARETAELVFR